MIKYAVVRIDSLPNQFGCHVYSKQSSNPDTIRAYKEQIKKTYPNCQVAMVTVERAREIEREYHAYYSHLMNERARRGYNRIMRRSLEERGFI